MSAGPNGVTVVTSIGITHEVFVQLLRERRLMWHIEMDDIDWTQPGAKREPTKADLWLDGVAHNFGYERGGYSHAWMTAWHMNKENL